MVAPSLPFMGRVASESEPGGVGVLLIAATPAASRPTRIASRCDLPMKGR